MYSIAWRLLLFLLLFNRQFSSLYIMLDWHAQFSSVAPTPCGRASRNVTRQPCPRAPQIREPSLDYRSLVLQCRSSSLHLMLRDSGVLREKKGPLGLIDTKGPRGHHHQACFSIFEPDWAACQDRWTLATDRASIPLSMSQIFTCRPACSSITSTCCCCLGAVLVIDWRQPENVF